MNKIRKVIAILMGIVLVMMMGEKGDALAANENGEVDSAENYDGFQLSWVNHGKWDVLLSASSSEGTISFQYDENDRRKSKTDANGNITWFSYNDLGQLIAEKRGSHLFFYE